MPRSGSLEWMTTIADPRPEDRTEPTHPTGTRIIDVTGVRLTRVLDLAAGAPTGMDEIGLERRGGTSLLVGRERRI